MARISGFVAQNDIAFEGLTVKEHLEFMVRKEMVLLYKGYVPFIRSLPLLGRLVYRGSIFKGTYLCTSNFKSPSVI